MPPLDSSLLPSLILVHIGVQSTTKLRPGVDCHFTSQSQVPVKKNRHFLSWYTRKHFGMVVFITFLLLYQYLSFLRIYWSLPLSIMTPFSARSPNRPSRAFGSNPRCVVWVVEHGKVMSISVLDRYQINTTINDDQEGQDDDDDNKNSVSASEDDVELYDNDQNCVFHEWQTSQHPACNVFHELISSPTNDLSFLAQGGMVQVFNLYKNNDDNTSSVLIGGGKDEPTLILKALRHPKQQVDRQTLNNIRVDAVVSERLASTPYILSLYGHCGTSVLSPLADQGSLSDVVLPIWKAGKDLHPMDKLKLAVQMANGVAALHKVGQDDDDQGSQPHINFAHNDLHWKQWIYYDGMFQLNDFNYGRLLKHDLNHNNETCQDRSDMFTNVWRAPEDLAELYGTSGTFRVEMADMYTLGVMLFKILHTHVPSAISFDDLPRGESPLIPSEIRRNTNEAIQALITVIEACCSHEPEERPTADEVATFLNETMLQILGPEMQNGELRLNLSDVLARSSSEHILFSV
jgi:serine/threonine protein kinase